MNGIFLKRSVVVRCFLQGFDRSALHRTENGNVTSFSLFLFIMMAMMGGLAIDLMKYEQTRTTLQSTLDRSTLAAASLTQQLDPESVVRDYFDAAGMSDTLKSVEVIEGLNFRNVIAEASAGSNPFFLHMFGIEELDAPASSGAEQRINNVEIVLVLDVSGSMSGTKMTNLKAAASDFVQTLLEDDDEDKFSIAIVPYNSQVNLGSALRSKYNATHVHDQSNSNCLEIPSSVYSTVGVSRTLPIPMVAHADVVSSAGSSSSNNYSTYNSTSSATNNPLEVHCSINTGNVVRLPSNDIPTLKAQINALFADGNTSITLGMKWGVSLLEPGARPMFGELVDSGAIDEKFRGRPYDFTDDESLKVIVLMTDGEHVVHNKVNDAYKVGLSPIWRSTGDGNLSIFHDRASTTSDYYVPHRSAWQTTAWNSGDGAVQQDWKHVWATQRMTWVAQQLYARALGTSNSTRTTAYNNALTMFRSQFASVSSMNSTLQQSCTLAKDNRVIVYGIAFEAPTNGKTQISQCSSSAAHYFDASGLQIKTAFRTIASNISQLRLTQ